MVNLVNMENENLVASSFLSNLRDKINLAVAESKPETETET